MSKTTVTRKWRLFDDQEVRTIRVSNGEAVWQLSDIHESHDPMDRVGGPYRLMDFVDDGGDGWFIVSVADSYFPPSVLVRADSIKDALEAFAEWCTETVTEEQPGGRYGLVIHPFEEADYDWDSANVEFCNGHAVDMESIHVTEAAFHSCEA